MTFDEYVAAAERRFRAGGERRGQAYHNALATVKPLFARATATTHLDPFYNDKALPEFLAFLAENW